jgi:hypothetical protein
VRREAAPYVEDGAVTGFAIGDLEPSPITAGMSTVPTDVLRMG